MVLCVATLSGCSFGYVENQYNRLTSTGSQENVNRVLHKVIDEGQEAVNAGVDVFDPGDTTLESMKNEVAKPFTSGKKTDSNVKTKEQLLEDAGARMIDEMRE